MSVRHIDTGRVTLPLYNGVVCGLIHLVHSVKMTM